MKDYQTSNLPLYGGLRNASPAYVACQKTNSPSSALGRFKRSHGPDLKRISSSLARRCHRNAVSLLESSTADSLSSYYPHTHIWTRTLWVLQPVILLQGSLSSPSSHLKRSPLPKLCIHTVELSASSSTFASCITIVLLKRAIVFHGLGPSAERGTRLFTS
jgi:hypothetical protein